jgi:WD40 repeat protein
LRGPGVIHPFFNPSSDLLTVFGQGEIRSYSVPSFSEIDREEVATSDTRYPLGVGHTDRGPLTLSRVGDAREIELWRSDSQRERLMTIRDLDILGFDRSGDWAACLGKDNDRRVYLKSLRDASLPMRMVHVHEEPIADFFLHPEFEWFVVKGQESGTVTVWPLEGEADGPIRTINDVDLPRLSLDRRGGRIISTGMDEGNVTAHVWDLRLCPQKPNR